MLANSSLLKVVLLGDSGVGKTALMKMYCDKKFDKSYQATIGADFLQKDMMVNNKAITMQIWDTAGQERFKSLVCRFYRGADACILVYDVTSAQSFERLEFWMREFVEHADIKDPKRFPFLIVGNKNDLHDQRKVSESKAKAWCKNNGDLQFIDTSAKVNHNVEVAFTKVVQLALEIQSDFEDIYNTDIADVMLSNEDLPTQQSGSASGSGMISSISEMFASGTGDSGARETSGRRSSAARSTRSETPQKEENKGIVQIAQDTGEGAMSFLEHDSEDEYSFDLPFEDESSGREYNFPHNDSLTQAQMQILASKKQRSDSIEIPKFDAPELTRKTSPQRPKGMKNISLGFCVDPDKQAMRDELTRLKRIHGLLPTEAASPSYSDSEESTAYWEDYHAKRIQKIRDTGKNLKVHFPESPNMVTGRQSPPAWYYMTRNMSPETPPGLITPDLPDSDSDEIEIIPTASENQSASPQPVPKPCSIKPSSNNEVQILYNQNSDSDDTPDMYYQSSESSIDDVRYDMAELSFTQIPDSHDVYKPRMKKLTKGVKNRTNSDLDLRAHEMLAGIDEDSSSSSSRSLPNERDGMRQMMRQLSRSDETADEERDEMREMMRQLSSESEKSDVRKMMRRFSAGEDDENSGGDWTPNDSTDLGHSNPWGTTVTATTNDTNERTGIFENASMIEDSSESETDDAENRAYIEEQLRLQKEREKVHKTLDHAELGGGPIVYYDDSDESTSSDDQEYVQEQLAQLAKKQANAKKSEDDIMVMSDSSSFEDEDFFDVNEVKKAWLKNKGGMQERKPSTLMIISTNTEDAEERVVLVDFKKKKKLETLSVNSDLDEQPLRKLSDEGFKKDPTYDLEVSQSNLPVRYRSESKTRIKLATASPRRKGLYSEFSQQQFLEVIALVEPWLPGWPALHKQFPSLFQKTCMTCCDMGWFGVVATLVEELNRITLNLPFSQSYFITRIESQYGGLNLHISKTNPEINEIRRIAREESMTICEMCGHDGFARSNNRGKTKTLCNTCEDTWYEIEDANTGDLEDDSGWD